MSVQIMPNSARPACQIAFLLASDCHCARKNVRTQLKGFSSSSMPARARLCL